MFHKILKEWQDCGCCPKDFDEIYAKGSLIDGSIFEIDYYNVRCTNKKKRIIW